ncbi:MAG TPA: hypothetical protein VLT45_02820 [Kofleriaceae bacterium]|nr:hypothetical protein [Kofleriaceae bacterium]
MSAQANSRLRDVTIVFPWRNVGEMCDRYAVFMLRRMLAVPSTVADFTFGTIIVLFQVGVRNRLRA